MAAILYLFLFAACGVQIIRWQFPRLNPLVRVWLGVSLGVLWVCKNLLGITDAWVAGWVPAWLGGFVKGDTVAKLIATPCAIVVNFIGNKLFVFRAQPGDEQTGRQKQ